MSIQGRSASFLSVVILCLCALPSAGLAQSAEPSGAPPGPATAARPLASDPSLLTPGAYVSNVGAGTSVTFDVADGAWMGTGGPMVVMDRDITGDRGELAATTFFATAPDPCERDIGGEPEDMNAKAFTDWLVAQPWAVATSSETSLGGAPAIQVDISALKPPCPDQPMFVWLYLDGGPYRLYPTEALRVIAQDRGDDLILVTAETGHAASLPAFLGVAMPVIDSMSFGDPIQLPSPEPSVSTGY